MQRNLFFLSCACCWWTTLPSDVHAWKQAESWTENPKTHASSKLSGVVEITYTVTTNNMGMVSEVLDIIWEDN